MKGKLEDLLEINSQLQDEQQLLRYKYDQVSSESSNLTVSLLGCDTV
jgi:hypothetical protein